MTSVLPQIQDRRVEEVRPGLWSIPVPIPNNPLGHTLVYCYDTAEGPVLIDTGWDVDEAFDALVAGLKEAGFELSTCYGVLVTHFHPDHHGLSGRVRRESGAWVAMHPEDARMISWKESPEEWLMQTAMMLLEAGAPDADLAGLPKPPPPGSVELESRRMALPDRLLSDGDEADVPGRDVIALWTPGHTPGHLCFYDRDAKVMMSGDHVLPRISPHIGLYDPMDRRSDPLGAFLLSLQKVAEYEVLETCPAHEYRFADICARVDELLAHHRDRLRAVLIQLKEGPATAWDIARGMPWNRPWDEIGPIMKRAALGEAMAHVRHLEHTGRVEEAPGKPVSFRLSRA